MVHADRQSQIKGCSAILKKEESGLSDWLSCLGQICKQYEDFKNYQVLKFLANCFLSAVTYNKDWLITKVKGMMNILADVYQTMAHLIGGEWGGGKLSSNTK